MQWQAVGADYAHYWQAYPEHVSIRVAPRRRRISHTKPPFAVVDFEVELPDNVEADYSVDLYLRPLLDRLRLAHLHHVLVDDHRRRVPNCHLSNLQLGYQTRDGRDPSGTGDDLERI